jgi:GNAT superfamily N-acetyltransferase
MPPVDTTIRAVTDQDWRLLRDIRLRALADAPDAFGATLAGARARSDDDWRASTGTSPLILLAVADGRPVAMGGVFRPANGDPATIWGMWTSPDARGAGIGGRLLDALIEWCQRQPTTEQAYDEVRLHVTEGNAGARQLYVSRGFTPTGNWEALRKGSSLQIEELRLVLRPPE